jgi:hypothetical protein
MRRDRHRGESRRRPPGTSKREATSPADQLTGTGADSTLDRVVAFLEERRAREIPHPGGTLFDHLARTRKLLMEWGARPSLNDAGLCHAAYGADGFELSLLEVTERVDLASLIGEDAEEIVYRYAACDRRQFFSQVGGREPINLRDRFTLNVVRPPPQLVADLMELTAANELDIMRNNPQFRLEHGRAIANLVARAREFVSEPARQAVLEEAPSK